MLEHRGKSYERRRKTQKNQAEVPPAEAIARRQVRGMEALSILKELVQSRKGVKRPTDATPAMGLDGTIVEFKFKSGSSTVFFQWWMALPKGYDLLDDLHSVIDDCISS